MKVISEVAAGVDIRFGGGLHHDFNEPGYWRAHLARRMALITPAAPRVHPTQPPKEQPIMNTEAIAPELGVQQSLPKEQKKKDKGLVIAGWVFAFLMPIVGFFIGLAAAIRGRTGHGIGIMATSVLVPVIIVIAIVGSAASSVDTSTASASASTPAAKSSHKAAHKSGAITMAQFKSVTTGMSTNEVKGLLGKAADVSYDEADYGTGVIKTQMWTYHNAGGSALDLSGFTFMFQDDKLTSKSSV
jgi:hypothetical protein